MRHKVAVMSDRFRFPTKEPAAVALALVGALAPSIALYAPKGISLVFVLTAFACLWTVYKSSNRRSALSVGFLAALTAFFVWSMASLIWSISVDDSWRVARSLPAMLFGGVVVITGARLLQPYQRDWAARGTVIGVVMCALLSLLELHGDFPVYRTIASFKGREDLGQDVPEFVINNGIAMLVLFTWPACLVLQKRNHRAAVAFALAGVGVAAASGSSLSAGVALACGIAAFLLVIAFRAVALKGVAILLSCMFLFAPMIVKAVPDARTVGAHLPELPVSIYPRLVIWKFVTDKALERPFLGHGVRSSRAIETPAAQIPFVFRQDGKQQIGGTNAIPLHPHNGILQLWLELGFVGVSLVLIVVLLILRGIQKLPTNWVERGLMTAALISSLSMVSVSYGIWQNWWISALFLQGAMIALIHSPLRKDA